MIEIGTRGYENDIRKTSWTDITPLRLLDAAQEPDLSVVKSALERQGGVLPVLMHPLSEFFQNSYYRHHLIDPLLEHPENTQYLRVEPIDIGKEIQFLKPYLRDFVNFLQSDVYHTLLLADEIIDQHDQVIETLQLLQRIGYKGRVIYFHTGRAKPDPYIGGDEQMIDLTKAIWTIAPKALLLIGMYSCALDEDIPLPLTIDLDPNDPDATASIPVNNCMLGFIENTFQSQRKFLVPPYDGFIGRFLLSPILLTHPIDRWRGIDFNIFSQNSLE